MTARTAHHRERLLQVTDDDLRHEFLRLLAQDGRERFMRVMAEQDFNSPADSEIRHISD